MSPATATQTAPDTAFWSQFPGIVWSNPDADDGVRIRLALLKPRFYQLVAMAAHFGLPRLQAEWQRLLREEPEAAARARPTVERMLTNIQIGFAAAATSSSAP